MSSAAIRLRWSWKLSQETDKFSIRVSSKIPPWQNPSYLIIHATAAALLIYSPMFNLRPFQSWSLSFKNNSHRELGRKQRSAGFPTGTASRFTTYANPQLGLGSPDMNLDSKIKESQKTTTKPTKSSNRQSASSKVFFFFCFLQRWILAKGDW